MMVVPYTSPLLSYAGRWVDFGDSKGSYWQGAQVRFKVSGTTQVTINAKYSTSNIALVVMNVDGGATRLEYLTSSGGTSNGSITYALDDTGSHEIVVKLFGYPDAQFAGSMYARLVSVGIDDGATLTEWGNGAPLHIGVIGDSWMGCENDWPRLLDAAQFSIYPTSYGGAKASELNDRYNFDGNGILNTSDPALDAVLINSSVNDLTAGVSSASFDSSLSSLVDKVQAKHPGVPVFLLQSPRNVGAGIMYDSYGANMQNIAAAKTGVYFLPMTSAQWGSYVWSDAYHLALPSLRELADYVGDFLMSALSPVNTSQKILLRTQSGTIELNLSPTEPSDENTLLVRMSDGYFQLQLSLAPNPSPVEKVLFRTLQGLFVIN